nr:uncharacterized protein LOC107426714 isoform X2 [Ziziphus jujuba var. spinosa]
MYADRVEDETKRSVKERLNGSIKGDSMRRRQAIGKRQRQDDKWEHDLYEGDEYQVSSKVDSRDLRLKLQRKSLQQTTVRGAFSGVRDLREKLSGTMHPQPVNIHQQKPKVEPARLPGKSVASEILAPETKKVVNPPPRKKSSHKEPNIGLNIFPLEQNSFPIEWQKKWIFSPIMRSEIHFGS